MKLNISNSESTVGSPRSLAVGGCHLYFKYTWGLLAWVFGIVGSIYAMNLMEYSIRKWILFGAAMMILFGGPIIFAYGVLIKKKLMR